MIIVYAPTGTSSLRRGSLRVHIVVAERSLALRQLCCSQSFCRCYQPAISHGDYVTKVRCRSGGNNCEAFISCRSWPECHGDGKGISYPYRSSGWACRGRGSGPFQEPRSPVSFGAGEAVSAALLACFRFGTSGSTSLQTAEKSPPCLQRARESSDRGGIFPACFCPASEEACRPVLSLPRIPRDRNREALP
jgi:hypothetical protein